MSSVSGATRMLSGTFSWFFFLLVPFPLCFCFCHHLSLFFFLLLNKYMPRNIKSIVANVDQFGFAMCESPSDKVITRQEGIFRTNCLDWCVVGLPDRICIRYLSLLILNPVWT